MILPPEETHERPVPDSRGLVLAPRNDLAWARDGRPPLVQVPGGYIPEDAPTAETGPCIICGEPAPMLSAARSQPYPVCPLQQAEACVVRALAKRAAEREQAIEQAPEPKALPAPPAVPRNRQERLAQAGKTLLGQKPGKADPKNAAELPADSAPGSSADPPPAGGAA